jgi:hypothetical protein
MKIQPVIFCLLAYLACSNLIQHSMVLTHTPTTTNFVCCPDTYVFDDETLACVCPSTSPFVDISGKCVSCPPPKFFDNSTKICIACPNIKVYDETLQACVCPYRFY